MDRSPGDLTRLLARVSDGEDGSREALLAAVYQELRQISMGLVGRESSGLTLSTTDVVHEAYLKLFGGEMSWENRRHFFSGAATAMRRILIDHARRKQAAKRGGERFSVTLDEGMVQAQDRVIDLIVLDDALGRLRDLDPRQARIVEMRYFAGLKIEETANALEVSVRTVKREWQMARAWLRREVSRGSDGID